MNRSLILRIFFALLLVLISWHLGIIFIDINALVAQFWPALKWITGVLGGCLLQEFFSNKHSGPST